MAYKILIVDDEPDLELLVRQKFRQQVRDGRFELCFAHNGKEALQQIEEDLAIDLVLSDINMPVMDGLTLLARLNASSETTAKTVIIDDTGRIVAAEVVQMGAVSRAGLARSMTSALGAAGLDESDIAETIATGYGRRLVPRAGRTFTEITCHARGVAAMCPGTRLVVDIGGQDSKAILVDELGIVENFAMNDRCASGTGRFFEVLARAIECGIGELADLALSGNRDLEVSSMCATFAETA